MHVQAPIRVVYLQNNLPNAGAKQSIQKGFDALTRNDQHPIWRDLDPQPERPLYFVINPAQGSKKVTLDIFEGASSLKDGGVLRAFTSPIAVQKLFSTLGKKYQDTES